MIQALRGRYSPVAGANSRGKYEHAVVFAFLRGEGVPGLRSLVAIAGLI